MAERDSRTHPLEDFVQVYFQDLRQDMQRAKEALDELQEKLARRLASVGDEPYLRELSRRADTVAERESLFPKLAEAFRSFGTAAGEEDVLDALIRHGQEIAPRVLLLVRRTGGWVRYQEGRLDEQVTFSADDQTVYRRAAEGQAVVADKSASFPAHQRLHEILGGDAAYCAAFPLIFGDTVPAVFYADTPGNEGLSVPALEILCQGARLAIRGLRASERAVEAPQPQPAVEVPEPPESLQPLPLQAHEPVSAAERPDYGVDFSGDVASPQSDFDVAQRVLHKDLEASRAYPSLQQAQVFEPAPGSTPVVPPAAIRPAVEGPKIALTEEEERQHADARRFARLLVSELKLYNEQAVTEGRRHRDIYTRLKQDINRSREMYSRRIHVNVTRHTDYFHEEMVKLLAEGDSGSLGADYPGSQAVID